MKRSDSHKNITIYGKRSKKIPTANAGPVLAAAGAIFDIYGCNHDRGH